MKRSLALLFPFALAACSGGADAPLAPRSPAAARAPQGSGDYIVVLREGADPHAVAAQLGIVPGRVYQHALLGFAARLDARSLTALRHLPAVAYVEADAPAQLFTTQLFPPWGLDRIDQRNLPLSSSYRYLSTGTDAIVYVLDTGIRKTHVQFGGRAGYIANGFAGDFVGDGHGSASDCHGHGTGVAAIIAGVGYGVAKNAQIRAGRVVDCTGYGTAAVVISAMDWIVGHATKPSVVNMSLGYGNVQSVRDAAGRLYDAGHVVVAAAGNGDYAGTPENACYQSPGGYSNALTVGATTINDHEVSYSNYGPCVDLLAPTNVTSAGIVSDSASVTATGTSAAAPHVAGVAAQIRAQNPTASAATVNSLIKNAVTTGVLTLNNPFWSMTPNKLLYAAW